MSLNYKVYALRSLITHRIYVGISGDPYRRIDDHNQGRVFSTKGYRPWKLMYLEECGSRKQARQREKYLKSGCGKEFFKKIIYVMPG